MHSGVFEKTSGPFRHFSCYSIPICCHGIWTLKSSGVCSNTRLFATGKYLGKNRLKAC